MDYLSPSTKETMKLIKPLKEFALLIVAIFAILFLFLLQGTLEQLPTILEQNEITGNVIQVGDPKYQKNKIDIRPNNTPKNPNPKINPKKQPQTTNENLKCWLEHGMSKQDLLIVGPLLQSTLCQPDRTKKDVQGSVKDSCLQFDIETDATTNICVNTTTPTISLDIPTQGNNTLVVPDTSPSYWAGILFVSILLVLFALWNWKEMHINPRKHDQHKPYSEVDLEFGEVIPSYTKKQTEEDAMATHIDKLYATIKHHEQQPARGKKLSKTQITRAIAQFNRLTDKLYKDIRSNHLGSADHHYQQLFELYLTIFHSISKENKQTILKVLMYFSRQLILLKKSRTINKLIQRAYNESDQYKITEEPAAKKEQTISTPQDLNQHLKDLKQLLEDADDHEALKKYKKLFTTLK